MLTKPEIKYIEQMIKGFIGPSKYRDDLLQEIYLVICELDPERLEKLRDSGVLFAFVYGIMRNQFYSGSSPFFKKYKKFDIQRQPLDNE